jgi:hypothetical protein
MSDSRASKGTIFATLANVSRLSHSIGFPLLLPYGSPTSKRLSIETIKKAT